MLEMQGFLKVFSRVVCKEKSCFLRFFLKRILKIQFFGTVFECP